MAAADEIAVDVHWATLPNHKHHRSVPTKRSHVCFCAERAMLQHFGFDPSKSIAALEQDSTIIAGIEMSERSGSLPRLFPALNASLKH
jgi:hypothetical protein